MFFFVLFLSLTLHSAEEGALISIFQQETSREYIVFLTWLKSVQTKNTKELICSHSLSSGIMMKRYLFYKKSALISKLIMSMKIESTKALVLRFC